MNDKERKDILIFLENGRQSHHEKLFYLLDSLSLLLKYKIKTQRASIHLIHKAPFAVIGFRRKTNYFFVEFYNDHIIESNRIIKINKKEGDLKIIHTVNILTLTDIDDNLMKQIKHSSELIANEKESI